MNKLRPLFWALSIGVLGLALGSTAGSVLGVEHPAAHWALLLAAVAVLGVIAGLIAELRIWTGAAGGLVAALLVIAVIAVQNGAPGPEERGTWLSLAALALTCAGAGALGLFAGLRLTRQAQRRTGSGPPSFPTA